MLMDSWFLYMGHVDLGPPHSILRTWTNWITLENRVYKGDTTATQFNVKKFMGIVAQLFNPWAPWSSTWSLIWKDNLPHYHNKLDQQLFVGMKTVVHNLWLKFMRVVTARLHEKPQTMLALSWCCKKSCKSQHFSHTFSTKWSYSLWLKSGTKTQGASSPILSRSTSTFQGNFIIAPNSTRFPSSSFSTQLAAPSFNSEKNGMQRPRLSKQVAPHLWSILFGRFLTTSTFCFRTTEPTRQIYHSHLRSTELAKHGLSKWPSKFIRKKKKTCRTC